MTIWKWECASVKLVVYAEPYVLHKKGSLQKAGLAWSLYISINNTKKHITTGKSALVKYEILRQGTMAIRIVPHGSPLIPPDVPEKTKDKQAKGRTKPNRTGIGHSMDIPVSFPIRQYLQRGQLAQATECVSMDWPSRGARIQKRHSQVRPDRASNQFTSSIRPRRMPNQK